MKKKLGCLIALLCVASIPKVCAEVFPVQAEMGGYNPGAFNKTEIQQINQYQVDKSYVQSLDHLTDDERIYDATVEENIAREGMLYNPHFIVEKINFEGNTEIPTAELEKLALENTNFSNTNKLGGAMQVENTGWTMAGLIAHTSGVPLKLSALKTLDKNFLPGVYSLGDILKDNGYNNYFMIGSDARFGGRENYFKNHGSYTIYDYYYAIDNNFIESDYHVWWGYEDYKLFNHAKEKIKEAAKLDKPFNFTILTVDTHFTDGYMDDSCKDVFDSKYANSLYCSDSKIYSFVKWIQKQDFYKDTVIIITGDHLTMQYDFYEDNDYQRTIYNTIINSKLIPKKEKNRLFSSFDMFPTTLASLGVEIEGNRLGLGVNLYSEEETLIEKLGYDKLNKEIMKKSVYYIILIKKRIDKLF